MKSATPPAGPVTEETMYLSAPESANQNHARINQNYDGTNGQGEFRMRAGLPVWEQMRASWPGPLEGEDPVEDLKNLIEKTQCLIDIEDKLCLAARSWIEQLFDVVETALKAADLQVPNSPAAQRIVHVMREFGAEPPMVFSVEWLHGAVEEKLEHLHAKLQQNARERDSRLALLHQQKISALMVQFLTREARNIEAKGLELNDQCDSRPADALAVKLRAFVFDPVRTPWPQPLFEEVD